MCRKWKQRRGGKCLSALLWSHPPKAWAELSLLSWCSRTSSKHETQGGQGQLGEEEVQGREHQRLIPDECISARPGGCGQACLYLWLCGCVWLPRQTLVKRSCDDWGKAISSTTMSYRTHSQALRAACNGICEPSMDILSHKEVVSVFQSVWILAQQSLSQEFPWDVSLLCPYPFTLVVPCEVYTEVFM